MAATTNRAAGPQGGPERQREGGAADHRLSCAQSHHLDPPLRHHALDPVLRALRVLLGAGAVVSGRGSPRCLTCRPSSSCRSPPTPRRRRRSMLVTIGCQSGPFKADPRCRARQQGRWNVREVGSADVLTWGRQRPGWKKTESQRSGNGGEPNMRRAEG